MARLVLAGLIGWSLLDRARGGPQRRQVQLLMDAVIDLTAERNDLADRLYQAKTQRLLSPLHYLAETQTWPWPRTT